MMVVIVNTRADLDALKGGPDYLDAMRVIYGSLSTSVDRAEYPEGYGQPDYTGVAVDPDWQEAETLGTIQRLGFATRAEFEAEYSAALEQPMKPLLQLQTRHIFTLR